MKSTKRMIALFLLISMILQVAPLSALAEIFSPPISLNVQLSPESEGAGPVYHTVHFYDWDGTLIKTEENVLDGTSRASIEPAAPTREGYTFMGWLPPDDYITGDVPTVYDFTAQYQTTYLYEVTVEYRLDSETGAVVAPNFRGTYSYGDTFTVASPAIVGYDASVASISGVAGTAQGGATELRYFVIYTASTGTPYQVIHHFQNIDDNDYDDDNAAITQNFSATTGSSVDVYALAEGLRPAGFTPDIEVKTVVIAADGSTRVDMYYTRKSYALNFNSNGGTYYAPFIARHGAAVPPLDPPVPERIGYTFSGWLPAIPATLTQNLTVEAQWTANSGVQYMLAYWIENANDTDYTFYNTAVKNNGTSGQPVPALSSSDRISIQYFTYSHYDDTTLIKGDGSTIINVYYTRNSYTVRFNLNENGSSMTIGGATYTYNGTLYSFTAKYDSNIAALWPTASNITDNNKDFEGWSQNSSGGGTLFTSKRLTFTSDLFSTSGTRTYYGSWGDVYLYELHYMIESLSGSGQKQYGGVWYNEDMDYNQIAYASGSWSAKQITGTTSVGVVQETTKGIDGDYDVWFYYTRNSYNLSFYNYNTIDSTGSYKFGADISGLNYTPSRPLALPEGYTFAGWYTTHDTLPGSEFAWSGAVMPANALALYARWSPPVHTLTYSLEPAGGGALIPYAQHPLETVLRGGQATRPQDPDPADYNAEGYTFDGWYYTGTNTRFSFDTLIYRDIDLYGRWVPRVDLTYTVRYRQVGNEANVLAPDKTVTNQSLGSTVTEFALDVANWYPDALSKSLLLNENALVLTFWYTSNAAKYTVYYVESGTGLTLHEPKVVEPGDSGFPAGALATETALEIVNYPYDMGGGTIVYVDFMPDRQQKSLLLTNDDTQSITFYYEKATRFHYIVKYLEQGSGVSLAPDKEVRTTKTFTTELPVSVEGYTASPSQINTELTHYDTGNPADAQILLFLYIPYKISVAVTKIWDDNHDQDGLRPSGLPVTLTGSDGNTYSYTLLAAENWVHTFYNLPKYKSGSLIDYTLMETLTGTDYELTDTVHPANIPGSFALTGSLTNTHTSKLTSLTVTKEWLDNNNQDGLRPAGVTVQLYADGAPYGGAVTVSAAGNWEYTWDNLPVNSGGHEINYTVDETVLPAGYNKSVNGYTITNTHAVETRSVTMTKVWNDDNNRDGLRAAYTVQLYGNGGEVGSPVTLEAATTTYTWDNLPVNSGGEAINYTVDETVVPADYTKAVEGFTITNTHAIATRSVTMTKIWSDDNNRDGLRGNYGVQLYGDSDKVGDEVILDAATLTYTWDNLPVNDGGSAINYTLQETSVPAEYTASVNGFTITNTHAIATRSVTMTKEWNDDNNRDGLRDEYGVQLYGNEIKVGDEVVLDADTLTYTWDNLPVNNNGTAIAYTLDETSVPEGYTAEVNGFIITNTHAIATRSVTMTKVWNDDNNRDGLRAAYTVQLIGNGSEVGSPVTLEAATTTYTWDNLPVNSGGLPINYTVDETVVPADYTKAVEGFTITNTHAIATRSVTMTKEWNDDDNRDGLRDEYGVQLYGDEIKVGGEVTLDADTLTYTWDNLPVNNNGAAIAYTLEETSVPEGYTEEVNGFTITNTHAIATRSVTMTKIWSDDNNRDGLREEYGVQLYGNEVKVGGEVTLDADTLTYTWNNLPVNNNGTAIAYTLGETSVPEGYTAEVNGFIITNTHAIATRSVTMTKIWSDDNNRDGLRDEYGVQLYGNEVKVGGEVTLDADTLTYTWDNLPVNNNGTAIAYTLEETSVPDGYTAEVNGFTITNTHAIATRSVTMTKVWSDDNNRDGLRGNYGVQLYGDEIKVGGEVTLDAATLMYTWDNLPVNNNGTAIAYRLEETSVPEGYTAEVNGFIITNTHEIATRSVTMTKVWSDDNNRDGLRDEYGVQLYGNEIKVGDEVVLDADTLTYTWSNLPVNNNGTAIAYTLGETSVPEGYTAEVNGFIITNTHEIATRSVTMTKVWSDDNNRDGLRGNYGVQLYGNEVKVGDEVVLDADTLTYTWSNLPVNNNGTAIAYTLEETSVPEGYTAEVNGFTITNTHAIATSSVTMTKEWNDDDNRDGLRDEYGVQLYGDEIKVGGEVTLDADTLTYTWDNLPVNDGGSAINYTLQETSVPEGYTAEVNGFTITNTHTIATRSVTMTKVWSDDNNRDGLRDEYGVQLYGDEIKVGDEVILDAATLTYTWDNLPVNNKGTAIAYTLEETSVPEGYTAEVNGFTITNTHEIDVTEVTMNKNWDDEDDRDGLRAAYTVQLYDNDGEVGAPVTLGAGTETYTWDNLPVNDGGLPITYKVDETVVPTGYTAEVNGFTITNTHEIAVTEVTIDKYWDDDNDRDGLRDDYTVQLYADDAEIGAAVTLDAETLNYTWNGLPVYRDGGKEIEYTVEETGVPTGYTASVDGFNITNTHEPETVSVPVFKVWDHGDQPSANWPTDVTVNLLAGGTATGDALLLHAGNSWEDAFEGLFKYENGSEIQYTVSEDAVEHYAPVITGTAAAGYLITNTYTMETVSVPVAKVWDHGDQPSENWPMDVTVNLLANGTATGDAMLLHAGNSWQGTFGNLPKYEKGNEIQYTVDEETVENYAPEITGTAEAGYTIANTYVMETVDISGTKSWLGLVEGTGTPSVSIVLLRDGAPIDIIPLEDDAYSFLNLPKYEDGKLIIYEVQELTVPAGYTCESEPNETNGMDFTNSYTASGTLNLSGTKTLTGREGTAEDSFTFKLYEDDVSEANLLDTQTVAGGSGAFSFTQITYTLNLQAEPAVNDLGDHTYIVLEETPASNPSNGILYDTTQYTVNVTVIDNGDGTLDVKVTSGNEASLDFKNSYEAKGEYNVDLDLNPTKALEGRELTADSFEFILAEVAPHGEFLMAKTNEADGDIRFDPLTYTQADIGQTFTYIIVETDNGERGMTYDDMVLQFSVHVSDAGGGKLLAELVSEPLDTEFNNKYEASGELDVNQEIGPTKALEGRELTDGAFEYTLAQEGPDGGVLMVTVNDADGTIPFGPLMYTQEDIGKTFEYSIVETDNGEPGMTYDHMVLQFSVYVSDEGGGNLLAKLVSAPADTEFNNKYEAYGELDVNQEIGPTKALEGRELTDGAFEYTLAQEGPDGRVLMVTVNDADGTIPFGPLTYTQEDIGKTFDYSIVETDNGEPGMTYDHMVLQFSVYVSDEGGGNLLTELVSAPTDTEFNNKYEAYGELDVNQEIGPTKALEGRELTDGAFEYTLAQEGPDGGVLMVTVNDADGTIPFGPLKYTQEDIGKTFDYSIVETDNGEPGMTYDHMVLQFSVYVRDEGGGNLLAELVSAPADTEFNNKYEANGEFDVNQEIGPTKRLTGRELTDGAFEYTLAQEGPDGRVLMVTVNDADGTIPFGPLTYTQEDIGKTFDYSIVETDNGEPGMTYDHMVLQFSVYVRDEGGGNLQTELVSAPADTEFNNSYEAYGEFDVNQIKPTKELTGRELTAGAFEYTLAEDGLGGAVLMVTTNDADGTIPFGPLKYTQTDIGKTFDYSIVETDNGEPGMTYDHMVLQFRVYVSDEGGGNLLAELVSEPADTEFNNSYEAKGEYNVDLDLDPTKELTGRDLADGEFEFELWKGENWLQTVRNTLDGNIPFLALEYTQDDIGETYDYTIHELIPASPETGMSYDTMVLQFSVYVSDEGGGDLHAILIADSGDTVFNNDYVAKGEYNVDLDLNPTKELTGRDLADGEFDFELWQDGSVRQTVGNDAGGNIPFLALEYTQDDIGKTYDYEIREVIPASPESGMTYDTLVLAFSVAVTDTGNGDLSAVLVSQPADTVFNNSYEAYGEYNVDLDLNPTKELTGRDLADGEFGFELRQGGTWLQTVSNTLDGNIPFLDLEYTQDDIGNTYDYTIHEVIPASPETGMTYDTMVLSFSVLVFDAGNGNLLAVMVGDSGDTVFNNDYVAKGEYNVDLDLNPTKELTGRDLADGEFGFELRQGAAVLQTSVNAGNGNIPFDALEYTELDIGHTYDYEILEVIPGTPETGMTYDTMALSFSVLVTDAGNGVLNAVLVSRPADTIFNNSYEANGEYDVDLDLNPTKELAGRDLANGEFGFELRQGADVLQTVSNDAGGNIPFLALDYTQDDIGETYEYTIHEVIPGTPETGMTYDTMVITFSVQVSDEGNGDLSAVLVSRSADTEFNNSYVADGKYDVDLDLNPTKDLAGRDLADGEFGFELRQGADVLQTVSNDAGGNIPFLALEYTQDDIGETFNYEIHEVIPASPESGMTYDTMVLSFSVAVTDAGNGVLNTALVSQPEDTVFNNSYVASGEYDVDLDLNPTKELTGRDLADGEFRFELRQGAAVLQTPVNSGNGNIPFAVLEYTEEDIGHTYDYEIHEIIPVAPEIGMTYDTLVLAFSVAVTDAGNGDLSAVLVSRPADTVFNNSYEAYGEYNVDLDLNPTKELTGRVLADGEFRFELRQGAAVLQTPVNSGNGNIPFAVLEYTEEDIGHTYDYEIHEIIPVAPEIGMTYDTLVLAFSVAVTDAGNGDLSAVLVSRPADTVFNNSYVASGEYDVDLDLNPTKELTGRDLADGEFGFELRQGADVLQTVSNDAGGNIPFEALDYTQDDIGKTYEYTIHEVIPGTPETGMTYDTMLITFSVQVSDEGNGDLSAVLVSRPADTIFNNSYVASGEYDVDLDLNPTKELTGRDLADGEFGFELRQGADVLQTVSNDAGGNIPFLALEYTQDDIGETFNYEIHEVIPASPESGMTYDTMVLSFSVAVTDAGNGDLSAVLVSRPADTVFNNSYVASGEYDVDLDLNPTKELAGRDLANGEFGFELRQGADVLQTVSNDAGGNIPFLALDYTQDDIGETYEYTIHEVIPGTPETGMTYDTMVITFSVQVSDEGNGDLSAVLVSRPADTIFNNSYVASGEYDVDLDLNPTKELTGRDLADGEFGFELRQGADVLQTVSNDAGGNIPFLALDYTQDDIGETYEYTIHEVIPGTPETGMTYDTMVITFSVQVSDEGNGDLSAVLVSRPADTEFNNSYVADGKYDVDLDLNPTKDLAGRDLANGEFAFELWQGGTWLQTVSNTLDGNIPFLDLEYTQDDIGETFNYEIHEVIPASPETGMTYDTMVLSFSVAVTDAGNGVLNAVLVSQPADTEFNNSYEADGEYDVDLDLDPTKELMGRGLADGEFDFELWHGEIVLQTVGNALNGNIPFTPLTYTEGDIGQIYEYTVHEVIPGTPETGMTYDTMVLTFRVQVTDAGNGVLNAVLVTEPEDTVFNNVYRANGRLDIEAVINPTKVLTGRTLGANEFTFELSTLGIVLQTVRNDAYGNIPFAPLLYTEADIGHTYAYTITEVPGTLADTTYSSMALTFTVTVQDAGNGALSLVVTAPANVVFNNSYNPPAAAATVAAGGAAAQAPADALPVYDLGAGTGQIADLME